MTGSLRSWNEMKADGVVSGTGLDLDDGSEFWYCCFRLQLEIFDGQLLARGSQGGRRQV